MEVFSEVALRLVPSSFTSLDLIRYGLSRRASPRSSIGLPLTSAQGLLLPIAEPAAKLACPDPVEFEEGVLAVGQ